MPFVTLRDGAELHYVVVGADGPWVAVVSSARFSHEDVLPFACELAAAGHRVLVHDRRNCGQSSLSFCFEGSEDEIWAADLAELLGRLGIAEVVVVGLSRGARVAVRFALASRSRPLAVGVVLWGLSGGAATREHLDEYYFVQYLRACAIGGMEAVCALDHFRAVADARPENRELLLGLAPERFTAVVARWREDYHVGEGDDEILGLTDGDLAALSVPTMVVPYYDRSHPMSAAIRAANLIRDARLVDFDPARHADVKHSIDDTAVVAALTSAFVCGLRRPRPTLRSFMSRRNDRNGGPIAT